MTKIDINPGHGGKDPGAIGNGLREKDVALSVSLKITEILKKHNLQARCTRTTDIYVSPNQIAVNSNNARADFFVSIHMNSFSNTNANGVETLYHPNSAKGKALAQLVQNELVAAKIFKANRGLKPRRDLAVLNGTKMPAILVELGFITNAYDANLMRTKQNEMAEAVAKGILKYLGIAYKGSAATPPAPKPEAKPSKPKEDTEKTTIHKVQVGAYANKDNADNMLKDLEDKGFKGYIATETIKSAKPNVSNKRSEYFTIGNAQIIKTTPDNLYVDTIGSTLHRKGLYGVNGMLFDTKVAPVTSPNSCVMIGMNAGKPISDNAQFNGYNKPARATLIYHKNGTLGFRQLKNINPIKDTAEWAVGGFMVKPYMDFKNEGITKDVNYKTAHTYIAYDNNGYVYLILKPNHDIYEIVPVLDQLKIKNALVLDGGGSAQLNHADGNYRSSREINTAILLKKI